MCGLFTAFVLFGPILSLSLFQLELLGMLVSNQTLAAGSAKRRNWTKGDEICGLQLANGNKPSQLRELALPPPLTPDSRSPA